MKKKHAAKGFDGPTVNGHPLLSEADVQKWFESVDRQVPGGAALSIAQMLNHYEFIGALWKSTPELREQRSANPSRLRLSRVAQALQTLEADLPTLLETAHEVLPSERLEEYRPVVELLDQVRELAPRFRHSLPGRGRGAEPWHMVARKVGDRIVETLVTSTGRRFGFGKSTSPAIKILQSALAYLGVEKSPEAIVDAMRPRRARSRKSLGK
jgi:hypothetical protein